MSRTLRLVLILVAGVVAIAAAGPVVRGQIQDDGRLRTDDGDTVIVTDAARAGRLRYAPGVRPGDRAWIEAAIARARPEAAKLIAEVDGLITVGTFTDAGTTLGITRSHERGFTVDVNITHLDGRLAGDRATVVLHELGHVIDFALVPADVGRTLDAAIPRGGPCGLAIDCDRAEERFADTFAKWALHGAVSAAGAGYGIPAPASIEDWGAPLSQIAYGLPELSPR